MAFEAIDPLSSGNAVIGFIGDLLERHRATIRPPLTFVLAMIDCGTFVFDSRATPSVLPGWIDDAQVNILSNVTTICDMMTGSFDLGRPNAEHVFLWDGDETALERLATILGGRSILELRAHALSAKRARKKKR